MKCKLQPFPCCNSISIQEIPVRYRPRVREDWSKSLFNMKGCFPSAPCPSLTLHPSHTTHPSPCCLNVRVLQKLIHFLAKGHNYNGSIWKMTLVWRIHVLWKHLSPQYGYALCVCSITVKFPVNYFSIFYTSGISMNK